jgi:hypothetical protein
MIYIATFEGHKSTFEAVGSTEDEALALLTKYVKESSPRVSQREGFEFFETDAYVRRLDLGVVYVDRGIVT